VREGGREGGVITVFLYNKTTFGFWEGEGEEEEASWQEDLK
jgi:hypothetical protein